jgi:release factor glutamine methyltransferase
VTAPHGATVKTTWADLLDETAAEVANRHEARWMIEEVSGEPWSVAVSNGAPVPEKAPLRLKDMVVRRRAGEPLQYVLGSWSFRTLDLMVDRRVLIPRPETEQVVEVALAEVDRVDAKTVVDLGTGSGAIALSIAAERKGVEVWATDSEQGALDVARANLAGLAGFAATRVQVLQSDWWTGLPIHLRGEIDLVVSNPPYISEEEMAGLDPEVIDWEPRSALEAGPVGTEAIEAILRDGPGWVRAGGSMVIEIAPHQKARVEELAKGAGFIGVETKPDLTGRPRVLVARRARRAP